MGKAESGLRFGVGLITHAKLAEDDLNDAEASKRGEDQIETHGSGKQTPGGVDTTCQHQPREDEDAGDCPDGAFHFHVNEGRLVGRHSVFNNCIAI